jgi:hypothetical protein
MGLFGNFLFYIDRQGLRGLWVGKAAVILQAIGSPIKRTLDGNLGGDSFDGRAKDQRGLTCKAVEPTAELWGTVKPSGNPPAAD